MSIITVQGAPNIYQCTEGALKLIPEQVTKQTFKQGLLIRGEKSWEVAKPFFEELDLDLKDVIYNGECSFEEVKRIKSIAQEADYVLAVGGGKVMDLGKAVADQLDIPYILVPTLASNCAPWTPLSVFYDEDGNFIKYTIFSKGAFMVLVEPKIIINSPVPYLTAGIADTIAKWYEADVLSRELEPKPITVEIALHAAKLCRDALLDEGRSAVEALHKGEVTSSFVRVVETIIMAGGMVGGYGDKYGRIAGAHSIHNGLTHVEETHAYLHGEKVAYGILVQLALEKNFDEIEKLLPFYADLKLPVTLAQLGVGEGRLEAAMETTARLSTKEGESIRLMNVTEPSQVVTAINELEQFIKEKQPSHS
ncbi:putative oxidoreductase [Evansella vedderi]|uniref:Oxidoreductase n=1 Tax=Evansella vedderi TaxID=38282 RepID=A0ABU0A0E9_9BACI|nr:iron-containing alcohol dehydrogenase family protein [Evansella vedderi]MDQ0256968.1 putative oxidoreductase [Evansella vedderi]